MHTGDARAALVGEPRNLRAFIVKADHGAAEGDERVASSLYMAAVKTAPPVNQLLSDLRNVLGRDQGMCECYAAHSTRSCGIG